MKWQHNFRSWHGHSNWCQLCDDVVFFGHMSFEVIRTSWCKRIHMTIDQWRFLRKWAIISFVPRNTAIITSIHLATQIAGNSPKSRFSGFKSCVSKWMQEMKKNKASNCFIRLLLSNKYKQMNRAEEEFILIQCTQTHRSSWIQWKINICINSCSYFEDHFIYWCVNILICIFRNFVFFSKSKIKKIVSSLQAFPCIHMIA